MIAITVTVTAVGPWSSEGLFGNLAQLLTFSETQWLLKTS